MTALAHAKTLNLIASQLEAASSLLKYAADDLAEMLARSEVPLASELMLLSHDLNTKAASIAGCAAFCIRLGEGDDEEDGVEFGHFKRA